MVETKIQRERALLIGADTGEYDAEASMDELSELARTAGAEVVATLLQRMERPNNSTYIGSGKLQEVKETCRQKEIDLLIVDDELTGSQIRNLEEQLQTDVIDRTMLILDIFAGRARSNEGKLQVELAQQKYLLPRLTGMGNKLSRLGGGIGTRGPGETKLESDKRHIRRRIAALEEELRKVKRRRERIRERRQKNGCPSVAIVGYTNVGKSTLLNRLTNAGVLAKDQLFATLDPTARELFLPDGQKAVLIDTVGLLRRLPHQLIQAFRSTLEEAANADVILNLCDISSDEAPAQLEVSRRLLDELSCGCIKTITVYNKVDQAEMLPEISANDNVAFISAKTGEGLERLLALLAKSLSERMAEESYRIPYTDGSTAAAIRREGKLLAEEYREDGVFLTVQIAKKDAARYRSYLVKK